MKSSQCQRNVPQYNCGMHKNLKHISVFHCLLALSFTLVLAACTTLPTAKIEAQPKALLDRIWPDEMGYQPRIQPLSKQDQEYAEAALIQWLESYLEPSYRVVDKRFFWSGRKDSAWGSVSEAHALSSRDGEARWRVLEEIEQTWRTPGSGLMRLWKVHIDGKDRYFAIAMTDQPVPGTRGRSLIARFELEKCIESCPIRDEILVIAHSPM